MDPQPGTVREDERTFRPELEGLRAVAVGLVLLFHAGVPGWSGGYVGVDVFFVLSGFLITGLLVRELRATGRIDLPKFYARRARRLLPAAAVALLATVVLAALFLPPLEMPDVAGDIAAAALYVSNVRFAILATDYLTGTGPPSPVLHYWSLGVEEQFYVVWPALLLGTTLVARRLLRRRRSGAGSADLAPEAGIAAAIAFVAGASFVGSLALTSFAQPWAFFSLPARAWELALGGLLAIGASRARHLRSRIGGGLVAGGLGLIVLSGLIIQASTPFPGYAALLPTVGAALVIAGGEAGVSTVPARLLKLGPVRYVGRISYSLYLWHWPIIVIPALALGHEPRLAVRIGLAGLSVLVAAASQRWVEEPIRHGRFVGHRVRRTLALAGATSLVVAFTGFGTSALVVGALPAGTIPARTGNASLPPYPFGSFAPGTRPPGSGVPGASAAATPASTTRPPLVASPVPADLDPALRDARASLPATYADGCHLDQLVVVPPDHCVYGDLNSTTTVVLFGDSHAAQWFPALDALATAEHWRLMSFTKSSCGPVDTPIMNTNFGRPFTECWDWRQQVFARIAAEHPALVVMSTAHIGYILIDGTTTASWQARPDLWDAGYTRTMETVRASAGEVVVIGDTPRSDTDPPICLSAHLDNAAACATPVDQAIDQPQLNHERDLATAAGALFVDPQMWVCPSTPCPAVIDPYLVYRDPSHMTTPFAEALARPLLAALPILQP